MKDPLSNYEPDTSTGCWLWKGAQTKKSYGNVRYKGKYWKAHRLFYHHFVGRIPDGLVVMHLCDNPRCVNPEHLKVGTQMENIYDAINKGRHATEKVAPKLTQSEAAAIQSSDQSCTDLAAKYKVSRALIWKIKNDKIKRYAASQG